MSSGSFLSSMISASPSATDQSAKKESRALGTARAEVRKRKREIEEEARKKRVRELGPFANYVDYCFKTQGFIQSYNRPSYFTRSPDNGRVYTCSTRRLLTLENINWMKAHGIEHLVLCQAGDFPLPGWWKDTKMSFDKYETMTPFAQSRCLSLLKENPDNCILIAKENQAS
jgi:hypothetical protein